MTIAGLRVPVRIEPSVIPLLDDITIWATRTNIPVRVVSGNDHRHVRNSSHYIGHALDLQSSRMDDLARYLQSLGYRVLWRVRGHFNHVHAEVTE